MEWIISMNEKNGLAEMGVLVGTDGGGFHFFFFFFWVCPVQSQSGQFLVNM